MMIQHYLFHTMKAYIWNRNKSVNMLIYSVCLFICTHVCFSHYTGLGLFYCHNELKSNQIVLTWSEIINSLKIESSAQRRNKESWAVSRSSPAQHSPTQTHAQFVIRKFNCNFINSLELDSLIWKSYQLRVSHFSIPGSEIIVYKELRTAKKLKSNIYSRTEYFFKYFYS